MRRAITRLALVLAGLCFSGSRSANADRSIGSKVCEREMTRAAHAYGVPLGVLYAVGLTETGRRGSLQPLAMNVDGAPSYPGSLDEALAHFAASRRNGAKLIDIGCMQINYKFHAGRFRSLEEMFDPPRNVDYAARFLKELRRREPSWTLAVARYHAGPDNNPAQQRYVCAVIANMVATGFGVWTTQAWSFCDALRPAGASRQGGPREPGDEDDVE